MGPKFVQSTKKFVQSKLPESFWKITKGRVEKPKVARASTLSKLDDSAKEKAVEAAGTVADPRLDDSTKEEPVETAPAPAAAIPSLQDDGEELVGVGTYQALCQVKTVDVESSSLFTGSIKRVEKSLEATDEHRRRALAYPVIKESTVVRTKDGRPLLYFLKKGIFAGMSTDEQEQQGQQSMNAIRTLINIFNPPVPPQNDPRLTEKGVEKMKEWASKGKRYGRYVGSHQRRLVVFS